MERSEPSLVPEWLKGANSGVGGATHYMQSSSNHQDDSGGSFSSGQRVQPHGLIPGGSTVDFESSRFTTTSSDRAYNSAGRRGPVLGGGVNERLVQDRESSYSRGYSNFGRSPAYRSYDAGLDRSDRDLSRERDWDWERDRERDGRDRDRDRDRVLGGFGGTEERDRERSDSSSGFRRPGLGSNVGTRYEADILAPLRRVQSTGSAARALENGEKKAADQGSLPTAPPTNSSSLTSSMQKAAFERNFPSLGAQERVISVSSVQSNLGNVGILSPRPLWQGSTTPRSDGSRSAVSSPGLPTGGSSSSGLVSTAGASNGEVWSSALAEVPSSLTLGDLNGSLAPLSSGASNSSAPSSSLATISVAGSSTNPLKMAETLVQNPPRVRTPPQYLAETQKLEELQLKQSRQFIPVVPKALGLVPREKPKPKVVVRAVDVVAPPTSMKARLTVSTSQVPSLPYRPPAPPRPDALKSVQTAGMILGRKGIQEGGLMPSLSHVGGRPKSELMPSVVASSGGLIPNVGSSAAGVLHLPRKPKQLLDRRAVPISPVSASAGLDGNAGSASTKDGSSGAMSGSDERRSTQPTQNRVEFFNALRRKAGLSAPPSVVDKSDVAPARDSGVANGKEVTNISAEEGVMELSEDDVMNTLMDSHGLENGDRGHDERSPSSGTPAPGDKVHVDGRVTENGPTAEDTPRAANDKADRVPQAQVVSGAADVEEEYMFLRSLGWVESAEEVEDSLTEEEIMSFWKRKNELTTSGAAGRPSSNHNHHRRMDFKVGSVGSETSGLSTSDSESDDDCRARVRR